MKCERPGCENDRAQWKSGLCFACWEECPGGINPGEWARGSPKKASDAKGVNTEAEWAEDACKGIMSMAHDLPAERAERKKAEQAYREERAAHEATKRELEVYKANAYLHDMERDQLRAEVERLKGELSSLSQRCCTIADENGGPHPVQTADEALTCIEKHIFKLRTRPQSEPATHGPEHGDEPHMCDASCRAARGAGPAKGVEDLLWVGENGSLRTAPGCSYTAAWAHSISQEHNVAVRTAFARGQASRANDGRLRAFEEAWRLVVTEGKTGYDESEADLEKAQEILAAELAKNGAQPDPRRYVVKVGGTTRPYDTQEGAEAEASALRSNWGIEATVEEVDGE